MDSKRLSQIITGSWSDNLKKLPIYQRKEIVRAQKIMKQISYYKFGINSLGELRKELRIIIK